MANAESGFFQDGIDSIQRLRRMVPERADWHLDNWGRWRKSYFGVQGWASHSAGLRSGGISGEDAFDHLCADADVSAAEIADAIIREMTIQQRVAISHVYEAAVRQFARMSLEVVLTDAAEIFWRGAQRKGLV